MSLTISNLNQIQLEQLTQSDHTIFGFEDIGSLVASYLENPTLRKIWLYKQGWDLKEQLKEQTKIRCFDLFDIQRNYSIQNIQIIFNYCHKLNSLELDFYKNDMTLKNVLAKCSNSSLNLLKINNLDTLEESLFDQIHTRFPHLQSITFMRCSNFSSKAFQKLESYTNFTSLSFCRCEIQNSTASYVLKTMKQLTEISFESCPEITGAGFDECTDLLNLKSIDLHNSKGFTNEALALLVPHSKSLKSISFAFCGWLTNEGLSSFIEPCSTITSLNLSTCSQINNQGITAIATYLPLLTTIDLTNSRKIELRSFATLIHKCTHLVHLTLARCGWVRYSTLKVIREQRFGVITLDLTNCMFLENKEVRKYLSECPNLIHLTLPHPF